MRLSRTSLLAASKFLLANEMRATPEPWERIRLFYSALVQAPVPRCRPLYIAFFSTVLDCPISSRRFPRIQLSPARLTHALFFRPNLDRMANEEAGSGPFWGKPEWRGEEGYYKMLASSFADLISSGEDKRRHLRYVARGTSWRKTTFHGQIDASTVPPGGYIVLPGTTCRSTRLATLPILLICRCYIQMTQRLHNTVPVRPETTAVGGPYVPPRAV